ncbi:MAG: PAS domain S-box protein [Verrucomicrobia bacterium]|nr:PAS domain S-box protein [Verrucomicrobiota bacterium]
MLLYRPEDVASGVPQNEIEEAAAKGHAYGDRWRIRKDGTLFWANGTMSVIRDAAGGVRGFVKVLRDLTERKSAENELRLSETRFRSLITATAQVVWTADAMGENFIATPTWGEYTGFPDEEVEGWGWMNALHPADRGRTARRWRHSLETKERFEVDYRVRRADGEYRQITARAVPILDKEGSVLEWVGVCEDRTEQRQIEEGLRFRDWAIQALSQGIIITDPNQADNPIIYASRGFEGITGYATDEVLGRNCRFLQGPDTDPATVRVMHEAILAGRECSVEILNYKRDGTPFWNALFLTPVHDESGKICNYVGVLADVTERRTLERAFQQSQKMDAIGRLAGGVAHDFNNLLTIIFGLSDMLLLDMPETNPQRWHVAEIRKAGDRAAALTQQLLAFSRKQVIEPVVHDLNNRVALTQRMLERLLGEDIAIVTILDPNLPRIMADPGQVDQVVMNLCVNARDAMPTGGRLTIETHEFMLGQKLLDYPDLRPGRFAQLCVTDTGHGMSDAVKSQIFEPFYTTKEPGKGTGLGLATVFGIVKQSNAHISVDSEVGIGTTFRILFPAVDDRLPGPDGEGHHIGPLHGTETILMVEDEEGVRKIARIALETQGYTVLVAAGGTDAIHIAERHSGPIHLVLTDVVMPDMGGVKLAEALRSRHPDIKILFMSGYTDDALIRHGVTGGTDTFLQKPFTFIEISKKVRAVLDETK